MMRVGRTKDELATIGNGSIGNFWDAGRSASGITNEPTMPAKMVIMVHGLAIRDSGYRGNIQMGPAANGQDIYSRHGTFYPGIITGYRLAELGTNKKLGL
jgi:hypothetical protein